MAVFNPNVDLVEAAKKGDLAAMAAAKVQGASNWNGALWSAARNGHLTAMKLAKDWGATDWNWALREASFGGQLAAMKLAKDWSTMYYWDWALGDAAAGGHIAAMELTKDWGATDWNNALAEAALGGHIAAMELAKDWGATDWNLALLEAVSIYRKTIAESLAVHVPWATLERRVATIELLLSWNAVPEGHNHPIAQEIAATRKEWARRQHKKLLDVAMALAPLGLPPYVVHWIADWVIEGPLGARERVAIAEGVARSIRRQRGME